MMSEFVPFDSLWPRCQEAVRESAESLQRAGCGELVFIRDLWSRVRVAVPLDFPEGWSEPLRALAARLKDRLGPHAYAPERAVLELANEDLEQLKRSAIERDENGIKLLLVDRVVTGSRWSLKPETQAPNRFSFFAIKGGVGRSTAVAVLASHLAREGRRVLAVDLDLESPGLSSLLLLAEEYPDFGIVDWFVEDAVGQGERVLRDMTAPPSWCGSFRGDLYVAPAHGRLREGYEEYIEKLGRVNLDMPPTPDEPAAEPWLARLRRLVEGLEQKVQPDVVLIDSRNGLHDLAAAAVMAVGAQVCMFALDNQPTWDAYQMLFAHWVRYGVAKTIRENLKIVASMIPETGRDRYLASFRERAWDLFRDFLYDEVPAESRAEQDRFTFDLNEEDAPHWPLEIYWHRGVPDAQTIADLPKQTEREAFAPFLQGFEELMAERR